MESTRFYPSGRRGDSVPVILTARAETERILPQSEPFLRRGRPRPADPLVRIVSCIVFFYGVSRARCEEGYKYIVERAMYRHLKMLFDRNEIEIVGGTPDEEG